MNRDDIIRMAREAGHAIRNIDGEDEVMDGDNYHIQTELIERFAHLVAAAEREACANIDWIQILRNSGMVTWGDAETLADLVSATIKARGQDPMPLFADWPGGWKE